MLAGRVICSYDRQPPPTIIQYIPTGERTGDGKPQEIATNNEGFFVIQGLTPGQGYQLTARTRDGDVKMGGITFAIAPNPRVLIPISEDFSAPAAPKKGNDKTSGATDTGNNDSRLPAANLAGPVGAASEITPAGGMAAGNPGGKDYAAGDQARPDRIPLNMGASGRGPPQTGSEEYGGFPSTAARVPSCVMEGRQLENFALYDLTGLPWEYRNHRGRLVLIDFWGTWCRYCIAGMPHLKSLHESYSKYGLEVIGIAYEQPAPAGEQMRLVQGTCNSLQIPYRVLLGSNMSSCPVKSKFGVVAFPSLFLLDENNRIIWKKDHALNEAEKRELDKIIREHLK